MCSRRNSNSLELPERIGLPYFAYGLFKPGEIAHHQIQKMIKGSPIEAHACGSLHIRDGLPLFESGNGGTVSGFLMDFLQNKRDEAYKIISNFEPKKHYYWGEVELIEPKKTANTLIGRSPTKASIHNEEGEWSSRKDPVFTIGLSVVHEMANDLAKDKFHSAPPENFDWPRLFRLQMVYLSLWTAIERYAALAYKPKLEPMEKVEQLGEDPAFKCALQKVNRTDKVYDSRDPE